MGTVHSKKQLKPLFLSAQILTTAAIINGIRGGIYVYLYNNIIGNFIMTHPYIDKIKLKISCEQRNHQIQNEAEFGTKAQEALKKIRETK